MSTPLGMCTCKEERVPSLTLVPGCKGLQSSDTPGCWRRLLLSHLPLPVRFSLHFVASFAGLVSAEGRGAIALYILEKTLGKGGGPTHPCPSPRPRLSPLLMALSLSYCASQGAPPQTPPRQPRIPRQPSSPGARSASTSAPWRRSSREDGRVCACTGAFGAQAWVFCPTCLWPQEQPRSRDSFQNLCLTFPLKHKTTH